MKRMQGIGLLQVVLALALAGLLAGVAWPALASAYTRVRFAQAGMALGESVLVANRVAAATGVATVLCPATAQGCDDGSDWSRGWLLFADIDGDRRFGPHDTLLQRQPPLAADIRVSSNQGRPRAVFQPDGSSAGSNLTFLVCSRWRALGERLVLSNEGRFRPARAEPDQIEACRSGGGA